MATAVILARIGGARYAGAGFSDLAVRLQLGCVGLAGAKKRFLVPTT